MSICSSSEAMSKATSYIGYYEKASNSKLDDFTANAGSANYTIFGKICGCNPGAWCAMFVSTILYWCCGSSTADAKKIMWGQWPHYNCATMFDKALDAGCAHYSWYGLNKKGKSGVAYTPKAGDVIIFTDSWKSRDHTGFVYGADSSYVYTIEGNSGNMCRRRSYALTDSYIYGYSTPKYEGTACTGDSVIYAFQTWLGNCATDGEYGPTTKKAALKKYQQYLNTAYKIGISADGEFGPETYYATVSMRKGDDNDGVKVMQGVLYSKGYNPNGVDGDFGANTETAVKKFQQSNNLNANGIIDRITVAKIFDSARPSHTLLCKGSKGGEVRYLQTLLTNKGYIVKTDASFGKDTYTAVCNFQKASFPDDPSQCDGEVGPKTWAKLEA